MIPLFSFIVSLVLELIKYTVWVLIFIAPSSNGSRENSKFLGNDLELEDRHFRKRRPGSQGSSPCNFGRPKNYAEGRTFFDLQYLNVEHNYNLNINCGSNGGGSYPHPAPVTESHTFGDNTVLHKPFGGQGGGGHRPVLGGHRPHHKPGKPGGGGLFNGHGNGGGWIGNFFGGGNNKPQKPFEGGPFSPGGPGGDTQNKPGSSSGAFAGILPSPQQFATGLSDGLQSFIQTIPAIGQSFQSILPSFSDFQLPQFPQFNPGGGPSSGLFSNPFNRPPPVAAPGTTPPSIVTSAPLTTTTDPDDIIYSDEIKPVHEDFDPITDPYSTSSNKLLREPDAKYRGHAYNEDRRSNYPSYDGRSQTSSRYRMPQFDSERPRSTGRSFSFPT